MREGQEPKLIQNIMADGVNRNGNVIFAILVTFCLLSLTPSVSANGDGVVIVEDSINITDFQTIEDSFVELRFNLTSVDDGNLDNFVGNVFVETLSIEGIILTNTTYSFDLAEGSNQEVITNLSELSYGYTIISVGMDGDIGIESGNNLISFQRTIQRLNPLNVSIASESSIIVESIKSDTSLTGNNSISDGDFVQFQIPIINHFD